MRLKLGAAAIVGGLLMAWQGGFSGAARPIDEIRMAAVEHKEFVRGALRVAAVRCIQKMTDNESPGFIDDMSGEIYSSVVDAKGFAGDGRLTNAAIDEVKAKTLPKLMKRLQTLEVAPGSALERRLERSLKVMQSSGMDFFNCAARGAREDLARRGLVGQARS